MPPRPPRKSSLPQAPRLVRSRLIQSLALFGASLPIGVWAMGLGTPLGTPVIGQPLRLEIPLSLIPGEQLPPLDCVRMMLPPGTPDRQFFPRSARLTLDTTKPGAYRIVLVSSLAVTEPLIEFRLVVGCNNELAKDFLVLSNVPEPTIIPAQASPPEKSVQPPASPLPPPTPAAPAPPAVRTPPPTAVSAIAPTAPLPGNPQSLRLTRDTNLNAMARVRYPENQATRDEYRRLMGLANPELFAGKTQIGSIPLPSGTVLSLPPNLPPPESAAKAAPEPPPAPTPKPAQPPKPAPATRNTESTATVATPSARKDRLVIGGDSAGTQRPLNPRELSSAIERMERMVEDQGRTELELSENLKTLSAAFIEVKDYIVALDAKTRQLEAEQKLQQMKADARPEPKNLGIFELLALIIAGGTVGAGLLGLQHRLQVKRLTLNTAPSTAAIPRENENSALPWQPPPVTNPPPPAPHAPAEDLMTSLVFSDPIAPASTPVIAQAPTLKPPPAPVQPSPVQAVPAATLPKPAPTLPKPVPTTVPPAPTLEPRQPVDPALNAPINFTLPALFGNSEKTETAPATTTIKQLETPDSGNSGMDDAIELASIMESMGLAKEAARTLVEHIYQEPKRDAMPWLKALEIYRKTGQRDEFDALAQNLRQHLNVQPRGWDDVVDPSLAQSLTGYRHLSEQLQRVWRTPECEAFLTDLLSDNRDGTRAGFPQEVAEEIILLQQILRDKG